MTDPKLSLCDIGRVYALDTETSGLSSTVDRVVQVSIVCCERKHRHAEVVVSVVDDLLIKVPIVLSPEVIAVHGISNELMATGIEPRQAWHQIAATLHDVVQDEPLVIFNARFDVPFVVRELMAEQIAPAAIDERVIFDPLVIDRFWDPFRRGPRKLAAMAALYGVAFEGAAHQASSDAIVAGRLAFGLIDFFPMLGKRTLGDLRRDQKEWFGNYQRRFNSSQIARGKEPSLKGDWLG